MDIYLVFGDVKSIEDISNLSTTLEFWCSGSGSDFMMLLESFRFKST